MKAWKNQLYFGDNLDILRTYVPTDSDDLIYLDPPFNSKATYNVLFQEKSGDKVRGPDHRVRGQREKAGISLPRAGESGYLPKGPPEKERPDPGGEPGQSVGIISP